MGTAAGVVALDAALVGLLTALDCALSWADQRGSRPVPGGRGRPAGA
jgi:hypothetical protein